MNNHNQLSYDVKISDYNNLVYNVYNFPNPFIDKTFFTFGFSNTESISAKIHIYTLNGKKIYNTSKYLEYNTNHFYQIEWNGKDNGDRKINISMDS